MTRRLFSGPISSRFIHDLTERTSRSSTNSPKNGVSIEDDDGALSQPAIHQQLKKAADQGGVDKPVNPHNFRHSAITRMRRESYSRSEIEHRVHWTVDTDMWAVYEHIAGKEHNDVIFEKAGVVESDDESSDHIRHPCGNCKETLAPHHEYCPRCGEPPLQKRAA